MKSLRAAATFLLGASFALNLHAQEKANSFVHEQSDGYEWPTDKEVLARLDRWQDQKFGVLFHWGLHSVPGICESWSLCSENWANRPGAFTYENYRDRHWGFSKVMNPAKFNPEQWADIMQDVARYVFEAFRAKNFMIGCYYSKPDWHCKWYWNPYYATPEGLIEPEVEEILRGVGTWMRANGRVIYNTRIAPHYHDGNVWFTADKNGEILYAVYALPKGEKLPKSIEWTGNEPVSDLRFC